MLSAGWNEEAGCWSAGSLLGWRFWSDRHRYAASRTGKGYRSMSDTAERIRKILAAKFGVDEATLSPDVSFVTDLNADSLDIVEISMAFEGRQFGIELFRRGHRGHRHDRRRRAIHRERAISCGQRPPPSSPRSAPARRPRARSASRARSSRFGSLTCGTSRKIGAVDHARARSSTATPPRGPCVFSRPSATSRLGPRRR